MPLPDTRIKSLKGNEVMFNSFANTSDTAVIISFWATWCIPCIQELNTIHDQYEDRQKETPFRFIAISIDDARTMQKVKPFVAGKGWPYEIYLDVNSDLKRSIEYYRCSSYTDHQKWQNCLPAQWLCKWQRRRTF
jgi:Thiol-disulfide isomerase and thioredoxins